MAQVGEDLLKVGGAGAFGLWGEVGEDGLWGGEFEGAVEAGGSAALGEGGDATAAAIGFPPLPHKSGQGDEEDGDDDAHG